MSHNNLNSTKFRIITHYKHPPHNKESTFSTGNSFFFGHCLTQTLAKFLISNRKDSKKSRALIPWP